MSSTAPHPSRLPRVAQVAARRALSVVPRPARASRASRVPFVALISAIMLGGVLGLLFFNTSMQQASFQETALSRQARDLNAQQEAIQLELDKLQDPDRIAAKAQRMGMVIPETSSAVLNLATGRISGQAVPAVGPGLPLGPAPVRRPKGLEPATPAGGQAKSAKADRTHPDHGASNPQR